MKQNQFPPNVNGPGSGSEPITLTSAASRAKKKARDLVPEGAEPVMIGDAVLGHRFGGRPKRKQKPHLASVRLKEFQDVLADTFGSAVDTDDGEWLLEPLAAHVAWHFAVVAARRGEVDPEALVRQIVPYVRAWLPAVAAHDVDAMAARMAAKRPRYSADGLAKLLGVSMATRERLRLNTIGANDVDAKTRKKRFKDARRQRSNEAKEQLRRAAGMRPQSESLAALARRIDVHRARLYEWKKAGTFDANVAKRLSELGLPDTSGPLKDTPYKRAKTVRSSSETWRRDGAAAPSGKSPVTARPTVDGAAPDVPEGRGALRPRPQSAAPSSRRTGRAVAKPSRPSTSASEKETNTVTSTDDAIARITATPEFQARHAAAQEVAELALFEEAFAEAPDIARRTGKDPADPKVIARIAREFVQGHREGERRVREQAQALHADLTAMGLPPAEVYARLSAMLAPAAGRA